MTPRHRAAAFAAALLAASPACAGEAEPAPKAAEHARPAAPPRPDEATASPYAAVRALQTLQDKVARGNTAAQAAQPRALSRVADAFAAADPGVWKESRNAAAAALFLFSAGRPAAVRAAIDRGATFTPEGENLVMGALAYAEGQDETARTLLGKLDPKALPASLGGHLALVLATLFAAQDPAKADAMLDAARLLVPGTLVEEAALRRQIFLLASPDTLDKFTSLSRQYVRRFHGSVFANNFKARLASFAVRLAVAGDVAHLARLDPVLAELPRAERRALYLTLSRDALVAGRPDATRYAAARAAALAPDSGEAEQAKLYAAAAVAASDGARAARSALGTVDVALLSGRDIALRDAAMAVADGVGAGFGEREPDAGVPPVDPRSAELIAHARSAIASSDALLAVDPGLPGAGVGTGLPPAAKSGRVAP